MAEHGCGEEVYAQYSVLEHVAAEDATVSALKEKTRLDILMDDTHPVLLLQLAPEGSFQQVTEALASACGPRRVDAVYEINGQSAKGRRKVVGAQ